jgi:hypothetical protein
LHSPIDEKGQLGIKMYTKIIDTKETPNLFSYYFYI